MTITRATARTTAKTASMTTALDMTPRPNAGLDALENEIAGHADLVEKLTKAHRALAKDFLSGLRHAARNGETLPYYAGRWAMHRRYSSENGMDAGPAAKKVLAAAAIADEIASRYPADRQITLQFAFEAEDAPDGVTSKTIDFVAFRFQKPFCGSDGALRPDIDEGALDVVREQLSKPIPYKFFEMISGNSLMYDVARELYVRAGGPETHIPPRPVPEVNRASVEAATAAAVALIRADRAPAP